MRNTTADISQVAAHTNVSVYVKGRCVHKFYKVNNLGPYTMSHNNTL